MHHSITTDNITRSNIRHNTLYSLLQEYMYSGSTVMPRVSLSFS